MEDLITNGKVMVDQARSITLYADTLKLMKFKYNNGDSLVRPNVGQVFHKIGRLYLKMGPNSQMNNVNNPSSSGCSVANAASS